MCSCSPPHALGLELNTEIGKNLYKLWPLPDGCCEGTFGTVVVADEHWTCVGQLSVLAWGSRAPLALQIGNIGH